MRVLVFDVGGTYTKYALVEDYEVREPRSIPTPKGAFMETISSIVAMFKNLDGVAIGFPGIVSRDGKVIFAPHLPSMVGKSIGEIGGIPVRIDNDANLFALGQYVLMRSEGVQNLVGITLGTGVGGGIVVEGKLYRGRGGAGEVGHIIIDMDGPRCDCGNYGCAEAFLGEAYFPSRCRVWFERAGRDPGELSGRVLRDMAEEGDDLARECWEWYGRKLRIGGFSGKCLRSGCSGDRGRYGRSLRVFFQIHVSRTHAPSGEEIGGYSCRRGKEKGDFCLHWWFRIV